MTRPLCGGLILKSLVLISLVLSTVASAAGWNLQDCEAALRSGNLDAPVYITLNTNRGVSLRGIEKIQALRFRSRNGHIEGPGTLLTALYLSTLPFIGTIRLKAEESPSPLKTVLVSETGLPISSLTTIVLPFKGNRETLIHKADLKKFDVASRDLMCTLSGCQLPNVGNDNQPDQVLVDQVITRVNNPYFFPDLLTTQGPHRLRAERIDGSIQVSIGLHRFVNGQDSVVIYHLESSRNLEEFLILDMHEPEWIFRLMIDREHKVGHLYTPDLQMVLSSRE